MTDPVSYDQLFPGRFVKAGLLLGKPRTLTIRRIYHETLPTKKGEQKRPVFTFAETDLEYVPCKEVGQCFRAMFGTHLPDWVGKRVTLYPSRDKHGQNWFGNDEAIRCKGSPDIPGPIVVTIEHPRKKPRQVRLEKTGAAPARAGEREMGED